MNQFIFCVVVDSHILYGTFEAQDGARARQLLEEKLKGRDYHHLSFKGVASKTYDFDVVGNLIV